MFVFDLDGTLVDSFPALKAAMREVLACHDVSMPHDEVLRVALSEGLDAMFDVARPAHFARESWAGLRDAYLDGYNARHLQHTPLFPGAGKALLQLHEAGAALAVCTNRDRETTLRLLQLHGLQALFSHVVALEDMARKKPAPDGLLLVSELAGAVPLEQMVFVGDSEVDGQAALNAQVKFCAHLHGYHRDARNFAHSVMTFDDYETWVAWALETLAAHASPGSRRAVHT